MKILVLHNNFPAQFKFLLPDLVSRGHEVIFLSLESHGNKISGVKHYKISSKVDSSTSSWKSPYKGLGKKVDVSEIFRAAFVSLKEDGFYPDISIFHSGWGIAYFLKSVFPSTQSFAYAEWWFNWDSAESQFDPSNRLIPLQVQPRRRSHINFLTPSSPLKSVNPISYGPLLNGRRLNSLLQFNPGCP